MKKQRSGERINLKTMQSSVFDYSVDTAITPAERGALNAVKDNVSGCPILDVGVGAGRTTPHLLKISKDYVGIDIVQGMTDACRKRYPNVRFERVDAGAMSLFSDNSFALVVFSCNGIAMVGHEGRLSILKEVYRVLQPGGYFLFSTYNQNSDNHDSLFRFPAFNFSRNPAKLLVRGNRFLYHTSIRVINRIRFWKQQFRSEEYGIINDQCHNYGTMMYYISIENQRKQLKCAGYQDTPTLFDLSGMECSDASRDDSITYIIRK